MRFFSGVTIGMLALMMNGCFFFTSRDDGEQLKQEVQHLQDRLSQVEDYSGETRQELEEMIARAQEQVGNLNETLNKATRVLARNSADFGTEMEKLKKDILSSQGAAAEFAHELEQMKQSIERNEQKVVEFALAAGLDMPIDESRVPKEAIDHFNMIKDSFAKGRFGEVRSLSSVYQDRYPKSRNLDEVQLYIGKSYVAQNRFAKALGALRRLVDLYPKSEHMPETLYEMANSFYHLGDCTDARILVETIVSRYKSSPFSNKAAALKSTMDKASAKCTS